MMSVMPGTGRGTNEESTIETAKRPKRPKPKRKCRRGEEWRAWGAMISIAAVAEESTTVVTAAVDVMEGKTLNEDRKSR
jgi:hypothetical protein